MFKKLLEKFLCKHNWKVFNQARTYNKGETEAKGNLPIRISQTLVCQSCGKLKQIVLD